MEIRTEEEREVLYVCDVCKAWIEHAIQRNGKASARFYTSSFAEAQAKRKAIVQATHPHLAAHYENLRNICLEAVEILDFLIEG